MIDVTLRIISSQEVKSALNLEKYIELVIKAHGVLQKEEGYQPLRQAMIPPNSKGILASMPAYLGGDMEIMGLKVVSVFHGNYQLGLESHQGLIVLVNPQTGVPKAILDAKEITAKRTAAASAAATIYLAKKNASDLAIIGAGVQARTHLEAISKVRTLETVTVWNRTFENAQAFVDGYKGDFDIEIAGSIQDAVQSADIICTVTAIINSITR